MLSVRTSCIISAFVLWVNEVCGIIASYSEKNSAQRVYQGLVELQHRGQDAAGIASLSKEGFVFKRGLGEIKEVFSAHSFGEHEGPFAIGHTRYSTSGGSTSIDIQPFYNPKGAALAHSGHLHPGAWMRAFNNIPGQSRVDSNLLLQFFIQHLEEEDALNEGNFFSKIVKAVRSIYQQVKGSYCVVCLIANKGLLVFRDPQGIRPLCFGERINGENNKEYLFASESHFFQNLGFNLQEVRPGELFFINTKGELYRQVLLQKTHTPCSFEYVYFAHPKTQLNGVLVEKTRQHLGRLLAQQWQEAYSHLNPDFVLPIPKTAITAAKSFAQALQFDYRDYFEVDTTIGRSFIQAEEQQRYKAVQQKLSIKSEKIKDKIILLFDDSIVRGTTAQLIVKQLRALGAKAIYLVSACPPIINICTYGINIPAQDELLAVNHSNDEIKAYLEVDELLYLKKTHLHDTLSQGSKLLPCMRCMNKVV
ncbi:amidophosphoribosyltransferase [Legionella sp. km772]|uniref:amidophosphoribosyltransferase n=1 Tax=Legionella sp. km772 TaxID=2498111 RepID=UPI000F8DC97D|nr:amidophosphoribosyltransferase [Legionella sp. km772]RUR11336.1 amidophosphoribosyltransferase [Legionella sp. km772]